MMDSDLNESNLAIAAQQIGELLRTRESRIAVRPRTLIMVRYADESDQQWTDRCSLAIRIAEALYQESRE